MKLKPELSMKYPIASIGLFGSMARGDFGPESDIDIIVDFYKPVGIEFVDLANELERRFQHKVDLISARGMKKKYFSAIQPEIIYV
ncbi:nucleotidyltransferase family protein [Compostibacter hankyongensis]